MRAGTGVSAWRESRKWKPESIHHLCYVFRRTPEYTPVSVIIFRHLIAPFEPRLKPTGDIPPSALLQFLQNILYVYAFVNCNPLNVLRNSDGRTFILEDTWRIEYLENVFVDIETLIYSCHGSHTANMKGR